MADRLEYPVGFADGFSFDQGWWVGRKKRGSGAVYSTYTTGDLHRQRARGAADNRDLVLRLS